MYHILADECSKPPEIKSLSTNTDFPISYNTPVTVHCDAGFSLVGDDVITCIKDDNYQSFHGHLPSCKESECVLIDKFHLLSNAIIIRVITTKCILQKWPGTAEARTTSLRLTLDFESALINALGFTYELVRTLNVH